MPGDALYCTAMSVLRCNTDDNVGAFFSVYKNNLPILINFRGQCQMLFSMLPSAGGFSLKSLIQFSEYSDYNLRVFVLGNIYIYWKKRIHSRSLSGLG